MFSGGGHGEWLNKLWYIYSVTYSAAVKKISRTIHANMKRYKDLLLSEIKQVNQDTYAILLFG